MSSPSADGAPLEGRSFRALSSSFSTTGTDYFRELVAELHRLIGAQICFVGELDPALEERVRTLAVCIDGRQADNLEYELRGTPCQEVVQQSVCVIPKGVCAAYPEDKLLQQLEIEAYAGTPLGDAQGATVGLLVALFRHAIEDVVAVETALRTFAARTAAELERVRVEARLRSQLAVQSSLAAISTRLLACGPDAASEEIDHSLAEFAMLLGVDRAFVFRLVEDAGILEITHEWHKSVLDAVPEELLRVPVDSFRYAARRVRSGELWSFASAGELPPEAATEREGLEQVDVRAAVVAPWVIAGQDAGAVVFGYARPIPAWRDEVCGGVRMLGELFGSALRRQSQARSIAHHQGQLRELATELVLSEERARGHVAALLHDEVLQDIVSAKLQLTAAAPMPGRDEALAHVAERLDHSIQTIRNLMLDLSPPVLATEGLMEALRWLLGRRRVAGGLDVQFDMPQRVERLAPDAEITGYQAVRELLANVEKHAGATRVNLEVVVQADALLLSVADDGCGFDVAEVERTRPNAEGGFGLFSLRERLGVLGGGLHVESARGQGTRVTVRLPRMPARARHPSRGRSPQPAPS